MKYSKEFWKDFWRAAGIRALRTLAQTAIATIGTTALIQDVDWKIVLSASALSAVLSILTSIATGLPEVDGVVEARLANHDYDSEESDE